MDKFNIYAFARPSTREEYAELLIEALRLCDELDEQIESMDALLEGQEQAA